MDSITKLLKKVGSKDRLAIEAVLSELYSRNFKSLDIKKMKGYKYLFRARVRDYRIIYFDDRSVFEIKYIKKRNKDTYSNL